MYSRALPFRISKYTTGYIVTVVECSAPFRRPYLCHFFEWHLDRHVGCFQQTSRALLIFIEWNNLIKEQMHVKRELTDQELAAGGSGYAIATVNCERAVAI